MTFTYNGVELEIIDDFCYLGVNLRFNLDPQWHLDAMFRRAKSSTVAIFSKLNARKMSFPVAKRLFDCAVNPVSMYGVSVFQQSLDRNLIDRHCMAVLGFYWKKWCGVPQCLRTTNIVSAIYMGTELTRSYDRKRVALAYAFSNGYHHLFCSAHNHPSNLPLNEAGICQKFHLSGGTTGSNTIGKSALGSPVEEGEIKLFRTRLQGGSHKNFIYVSY